MTITSDRFVGHDRTPFVRWDVRVDSTDRAPTRRRPRRSQFSVKRSSRSDKPSSPRAPRCVSASALESKETNDGCNTNATSARRFPSANRPARGQHKPGGQHDGRRPVPHPRDQELNRNSQTPPCKNIRHVVVSTTWTTPTSAHDRTAITTRSHCCLDVS
jgi:hypothetical protein